MSRRPIGLAPGADPEAAGQDTRKYASKNPVVRWLISRWIERVGLVAGDLSGVVVDIGIGEGIVLERLRVEPSVLVGIDYRRDKLHEAKRRLPPLCAVRADAGMVPLRDRAADVCLCTEVLEHLVTPEAAVAELARVTGRKCVVSVPWEPFFHLGNLLRGKNLRRWGDDVEHAQHFTRRGLRRVLGVHFVDVQVTSCFPWLLACCASPRS